MVRLPIRRRHRGRGDRGDEIVEVGLDGCFISCCERHVTHERLTVDEAAANTLELLEHARPIALDIHCACKDSP